LVCLTKWSVVKYSHFKEYLNLSVWKSHLVFVSIFLHFACRSALHLFNVEKLYLLPLAAAGNGSLTFVYILVIRAQTLAEAIGWFGIGIGAELATWGRYLSYTKWNTKRDQREKERERERKGKEMVMGKKHANDVYVLHEMLLTKHGQDQHLQQHRRLH